MAQRKTTKARRNDFLQSVAALALMGIAIVCVALMGVI
jgi:hypothetical protein